MIETEEITRKALIKSKQEAQYQPVQIVRVSEHVDHYERLIQDYKKQVDSLKLEKREMHQ